MVHVTELRCDTCGNIYDALKTDTLFTCTSCAKTKEIVNGKKTLFKVSAAIPSVPSELDIIYLPFWKIPVQIQMTNPEGVLIDVAMMHHPDTVWINAFFEMHAEYMGNPGQDMTRENSSILEAERFPEHIKIYGGARTFSNAFTYAKLFITDIIDKQKDVTGYNIEVKSQNPSVVAVPFGFESSSFEIINLTNSKKYKAIVVEEMQQILKKLQIN